MADPDSAQVWWCIDSGAGSWWCSVVLVVVVVVGGQLVSYNQTLAPLTALYTALHTRQVRGKQMGIYMTLTIN